MAEPRTRLQLFYFLVHDDIRFTVKAEDEESARELVVSYRTCYVDCEEDLQITKIEPVPNGSRIVAVEWDFEDDEIDEEDDEE